MEPAEPLTSYGIVTDVDIPAIAPARITWQKLTCNQSASGVNGPSVTCATHSLSIIQAATTAAFQQGQGWVDLVSVKGVCLAIHPTKKYSERYKCVALSKDL